MSSGAISSDERERKELRLFLAAALPAFLVYLDTLAPSVSPEDSGELITAAYTLGIAHPPGYPLWCLLGKAFSFIPLGSVAWRVNLLSAALGALSAGVLALIAFRFTRSFSSSLAAALAFAFSRDFWSQAVIAEVYTLNVLLFLLLIFFVLRHEDTCRRRWLYLAAFTLGLGLTNHSTLGPLAPVFFGWVLLRHLYLFRKPVFLLNVFLALVLGFSIVLYLPMRSAADPFMDWGDPETLPALLDHILRRQYTAAAVPRPRSFETQLPLVLGFVSTYAAQFTAWVGGLALLGALLHAQRERSSFLLLGLLWGLTSYGFIWLLNDPPDREHFHLSRVLFLPAHAVAAVWIAMALAGMAERFGDLARELSSWRRLALRACLLPVVLLPLFAHRSFNDRSGDWLAEDWGRNILESLKPDAILLPFADHSTFPAVYLQAVEGLRPDVLIGNKYGYIEDRVLLELFRRGETPREPPPFGGSAHDKERYLIEHSGRPVYLSTKDSIPGLQGHELRTWGLVFEAAPKDSKPDAAEHEALWGSFRFREGSLLRPPGEFSLDLILSDYHYARGRHALLFGREREALEALKLAGRYGAGVKEMHNNLGGTLAEAGHPELALPFLRNALALDPDYDLAGRNLAGVLHALKRWREGLPWFERALDFEPGNPLFRLAVARGYKEAGEKLLARLWYVSLLRDEPQSATLREEVEAFLSEAYGKEALEALPAPELAQEDRKRMAAQLESFGHPAMPHAAAARPGPWPQGPGLGGHPHAGGHQHHHHLSHPGARQAPGGPE
jgi:tetratricopeptide (TPR) repeat protein